MAINLQKGQRVALDSSITRVLVGLGWDVNKFDSGGEFDLDVSCFLLGENGKAGRDEDFVFYNNLKSRNGAVVHTGDNRTGAGEGDDEVVMIDFKKMPDDVKKVAVCVTIHEAEARRQNFGQVSNAYVRVDRVDGEFETAGTPVLQFDLMEEFSIETALVVCEIYKHDSAWKFNAVAAGYQGGLAALCRSYGLSV
ncbi:MAG: TerD family protein [Synergistaceae bacterium]|jgi:tellurium resistance protein TerD|nr:TerD family protein [Synergistaceae bacterium]